MQYMLLVKASNHSEQGIRPNERLREQMDQYNELLESHGVKVLAKGLHPSSEGIRFVFSKASEHAVIQKGPFHPTNTVIAGFFLLEVGSYEEAVHFASLAPDPQGDGEGEIELRQVY